MNKKEEIEQFRRDLKSVKFWSDKIMEINLEIEAVDTQKKGISTTNYEVFHKEELKDPTHPYNLQLDELKRQLLQVRAKFMNKIQDVEMCFESIEDEIDKHIIFDVYILNERFSKVAIKYSYAESTIFDRITKVIAKII